MTRLFLSLTTVLAIGFAVAAFPTDASAESRDERRQRNCASYGEMIETALKTVGAGNLTPQFLKDSNAFLEAGCLSNVPACPKTETDFAFADLLIVMTVSANMGSTFTPFRCPAIGPPDAEDQADIKQVF